MKKGAAIFLASFYLLTMMSLTVNFHYCSGELKSVSVFGKAKSCCGDGKNCCHDKKVTYKVKGSHEGASILNVPKNSLQDLFILPVETPVLCSYIKPLIQEEILSIHAPPDKPIETWLLFRSILI